MTTTPVAASAGTPVAGGGERDVARRSALATGAGLTAFVLVAYHRVALLGETWYDRDALLLVLPSSDFLASSLRAGRIPQWADWVGLGVPFAANPLHGVLYPPFWLSVLLPGAAGRDLLVLVHLVVAACGVAALSWRLGARGLGAFVAGATFASCGYVASMPPNNSVHLLAWTPWVAWAADRVAGATAAGFRAGAAASLAFAGALAAQLSVGEPAHAVTAGLLAGGVVLVRAPRRVRGLAWLGAGALVAVLLAAAPLLPAARVLGWSSRADGLAADLAVRWWTSPARLLEMIWPNAFGVPHPVTGNLARVVADSWGEGGLLQGPTWAFSLYLGLPVLLLAGASAGRREGRWLLGLAAFFLLLAMGPVTPLHGLLRAVLPPERMARYPEKHLVGMLVVVCGLAGAGFTAAFSPAAGRGGRLTKVAAISAAAFAGVLFAAFLGRDWLAAALLRAARHIPHPVDVDGGLRFATWSGGLALASAAAFAAALWARRWHVAAAGMAAALVVAAGGVAQAGALTRTIPRSAAASTPRLLASIPHPRPPSLRTRVVTAPLDVLAALRTGDALGEMLLARPTYDLPALHGFAALPGDDSLTGSAFLRYQRIERDMFPFASRLGAEYLLVDLPFATSLGLPLLERDVRWGGAVMRTPGTSARAFVAPRWRRAADPVAAWAQSPRDDGRIFLAANGDESPIGAESTLPHPCQARSPWPERVELSCLAEEHAYAVLLDSAAPGWAARVDGQAAPIEEANGLFRAVRIPPGAHQVTFEYRTPGLVAGAVVSLLAWTAWGIALRALRRRRAPGGGDAATLTG